MINKKCSAIQEYCESCRRIVGIPENKAVTDYHLHEEHLKEQDALLKIIQNQSRPQFGREVGANLVGSAIFWVLEKGLKRFL